MIEYLDELAQSFAEAAPFIEAGRNRLHAILERAFRTLTKRAAAAREEWELVAPESGPALLSFAPPRLSHPIADVRWEWSDLDGAAISVAGNKGGAKWLSHLLDSRPKTVSAALFSPLADIRHEWSVVDAQAQAGMTAAIEKTLSDVETWFEQLMSTAELLAPLAARSPRRAVFCGRNPWGTAASWADVRHGFARAAWRQGSYLEVVFVDDALPEISPETVDLIVFEAPVAPPVWAHEGADEQLRSWLGAGALMVFVGDWLDGRAWRQPGILCGAMPIEVIGDAHKAGEWDEVLRFNQLEVVGPDVLHLGSLCESSASVSGALRCRLREGATSLVDLTRRDGTTHPFVALGENNVGRCLAVASGTGGWGKGWSKVDAAWVPFWAAVLLFAEQHRAL